jgi:hypothetical protein
MNALYISNSNFAIEAVKVDGCNGHAVLSSMNHFLGDEDINCFGCLLGKLLPANL